jgi:hypothetical protein
MYRTQFKKERGRELSKLWRVFEKFLKFLRQFYGERAWLIRWKDRNLAE